ncbi:MAG: pyridoxamine 5'-phosphate oxidase family protein [Thermomicrobiales bacterium]
MIEAPVQHTFTDRVTSEAELRAVLGEPRERVIKKQLPALDRHCRAFIALSPFVLLATACPDGTCDVSPRGDAPGFVLVLDDRTLAIPDRPGNRRIDSLRNIVANGSVGLLFMIPGVEETLRANGHATIVRDADLRARLEAQGKVPELAIVVELAEIFLHCAKALKRSQLWDATTWPERDALPTLAQMIYDQVPMPDTTVEALEASLADDYRTRLY